MGIFGNTFGLPHLIIILVIILLLFGAPKLPGLARSVGQSMKIFRNEIKDPAKDETVTDTPAAENTTVVDSSDATAESPAKKSKSS